MDVIEFPVESAQHSYLAIGRLNPPPEHATICRLKVRIHPLRYSVDFGLAIGDSNAGLWLCDGMEIWYKIIPPAMAEYDSIVQKDLLLCENIIALHNALIRVDTELCDQDEHTLLCYTNLTLDEVYERTKTHTPFDRAIIRSNRASVESNLSNAIDFKRSPRFRNSLKVVLPVPVLGKSRHA